MILILVLIGLCCILGVLICFGRWIDTRTEVANQEQSRRIARAPINHDDIYNQISSTEHASTYMEITGKLEIVYTDIPNYLIWLKYNHPEYCKWVINILLPKKIWKDTWFYQNISPLFITEFSEYIRYDVMLNSRLYPKELYYELFPNIGDWPIDHISHVIEISDEDIIEI